MKHSVITLALAGILAAIPFAKGPLSAAFGSANAFADASLTSPAPLQQQETFATYVRKRNALKVLREEVIKVQTADGGKLTPAHHDYLQAKYNAIMAGNY